jgi:hypothetical protein
MRKTPLEIANGPHQERLHWILDATDPRELHELFRHASVQSHSGEYLVATNGIRLLVAESQAASAAKMERQTDKLIVLTRWIVALTVALLLFTIVLYKDTHALVEHETLKQHDALQNPKLPP